ncbi:MAG: hypothetical protein PHT12_03200 [Patescibacteria group bacterium]|nr:hypothetical protein [Patescibacteria group bacterium]
MAHDFQAGPRPPRQKVDVSALGLKCAQCQTPITELPFQPDPNRDVYCDNCNRARRQSFGPRDYSR